MKKKRVSNETSNKKAVLQKLNEYKIKNQYKLIVNRFASNFFSLSIICLNFATLSLCVAAIVILSIDISKNQKGLIDIIFPLIVSIFTISLFIGSILLIIFNNKNKDQSYSKKTLLIQYLILKLKNDPNFSLEHSIEMFNKIEEEFYEMKNVNYKKIIKKVLESSNNGKK